jgi:hypothetical protein
MIFEKKGVEHFFEYPIIYINIYIYIYILINLLQVYQTKAPPKGFLEFLC